MNGARYGKSKFELPACCSSGSCKDCRVAEGTGKEFFDYWGIEEDAPLFPDQPDFTQLRDQLDSLLKR